jgi:hypothetical protein
MHLPPSELSAKMAAMRVWLDERRFEPSTFNCHPRGAAILVRLDFKVANEAEAFAERFGGRTSGEDRRIAELAEGGAVVG